MIRVATSFEPKYKEIYEQFYISDEAATKYITKQTNKLNYGDRKAFLMSIGATTQDSNHVNMSGFNRVSILDSNDICTATVTNGDTGICIHTKNKVHVV